MAQEDDDKLEASGALGTPKQRWRYLSRILFQSATLAAGLMAIASSVITLFDMTNSVEEVFWQIPDQEYRYTIARLEETSKELVQLQGMTTGEALEIAKRSQASVDEALSVLDSLPYVKRSMRAEDYGLSLPSIFSPAYAQDAKAPESNMDYMQRIMVFGLVGCIVLVLMMLVLLYMFTKDRGKKAFAEKTITTMVGFIFGLITGSMTGKYH